VYLPSEADFNEGVANFIGEEASVRFFTETRGAEAGQRERERILDDRIISHEVLAFRREVEQLYASGAAEGPRSSTRAAAETRARGEIARLRLRTRNPAQVASQVRLSDACLALASTYLADMPAYQAKLASLGGDLPAFIARLRKASEAEDPRSALLAGMP
jgi:predicted aminopeptidase